MTTVRPGCSTVGHKTEFPLAGQRPPTMPWDATTKDIVQDM